MRIKGTKLSLYSSDIELISLKEFTRLIRICELPEDRTIVHFPVFSPINLSIGRDTECLRPSIEDHTAYLETLTYFNQGIARAYENHVKESFDIENNLEGIDWISADSPKYVLNAIREADCRGVLNGEFHTHLVKIAPRTYVLVNLEHFVMYLSISRFMGLPYKTRGQLAFVGSDKPRGFFIPRSSQIKS